MEHWKFWWEKIIKEHTNVLMKMAENSRPKRKDFKMEPPISQLGSFLALYKQIKTEMIQVFYGIFIVQKNGRRDLRRILQRGGGKRIWLMCWIKIRLKKSDEIILEKAYMGNFQIPNLAMSAKSLQKTVEPNHEGNGQKWPLVKHMPGLWLKVYGPCNEIEW